MLDMAAAVNSNHRGEASSSEHGLADELSNFNDVEESDFAYMVG